MKTLLVITIIIVTLAVVATTQAETTKPLQAPLLIDAPRVEPLDTSKVNQARMFEEARRAQ